MTYKSTGIIYEQKINSNLHGYIVGFDFGEFRYEPFASLLMDTLVDFAFGYHTGILKTYDRRTLIEAAKSLYTIKEFSDVKFVYVDNDEELYDCELQAQDKYLKRGEFGELILHLLLRDFFKTTPLVSKVYFKDTDGGVVHGFDLVHIGKDLSNPNENSIFLGESKLYSRKDGKAGKHGVEDLAKDIEAHFSKDFLNREITLIGKKKHSFIPSELLDESNKTEYEEFLKEKAKWFDILTKVEKDEIRLQDFLSSVTVPLVCTYQSELFNNHNDETTEEFKSEYNLELLKLKSAFDAKLNAIPNVVGQPIRTKLNIVLLLLPVPSKKQLIKLLHQKLYNQQNA
ncbi:MAG: DUF1837 domain-containing protein [Bacteroidetes bacterium]|nr:DUF1837 domain-containing protein [Bacteroidota bacterium]